MTKKIKTGTVREDGFIYESGAFRSPDSLAKRRKVKEEYSQQPEVKERRNKRLRDRYKSDKKFRASEPKRRSKHYKETK